MGSGGLRGLQIPRSGVCNVRGGFDSHAFPPLLRVLLLALACVLPVVASAASAAAPPAAAAKSPATATTATTVAAPAPHDSLIVFGHDSTDVRSAADSLAFADEPDTLTQRALAHADSADADTSKARRTPPPEFKGFEAPHWVMLRSAVVPGWGQLHNGSWKKAVAIAGLEGLLVSKIVSDQSALRSLSSDIDVAHATGTSAQEAGFIAQYNTRADRSVAHQWWLGALLAYSMLDAYIDAHFRNFHIDLDDDPALPPEQRRAAGLKLSWQERF